MENCPIVLLYGTYSPVALMLFVFHTISYICDSMSKICGFYGGSLRIITSTKGTKGFCFSGLWYIINRVHPNVPTSYQ